MMSDSAMNFAAEGVLRDTARTEILFIDSGVQGYQALVEGARPGLEIVVLSAGMDGIAQIAAVLSGRSGVDAVHVISHGTPGTLLLGAGSIGLEDLDGHSTELATIRQALSEGADMLLYGCDVAAGDAGQAFVARLAELTGADVAASEDLTGAAFKGGDWRLEVATGTIEAGAALSAEMQDTYAYTLAPADQNFDTELEGHLDPAGETIAGVTYTLVSPGGFLALTQTPAFVSITPDASDLAVMFNYDGVVVEIGALDARIAAADGAEFRLVSMEIDTGTGLGTSSQLTIMGYRDGAAVVGASDTIDTSISDAGGSVTYVKNAVAAGRGGVLTFDSNWQFVDEIRFTGVDTIVAVDELNFAAAVAPNAAPVIDANGAAGGVTNSTSFTENGPAVRILTSDATIADDDNLTGMTFTLAATPNGASEVMAYSAALNGGASLASLGLTGSYNNATGIYTISGTASSATYQSVARAMVYSNSSDAPAAASRTVTISATDAEGATGQATATIAVVAVNDAPSATNLTQSKAATQAGPAVALDDIAVTDIDTGDTVTATLTLSDPAAGTLSTGTFGSATSTFDAGTGVWTVAGSVADVNAALASAAVTPSAGNAQDFSITTRIRDAGGTGPADGTITVSVTPLDTPPSVVGNISVPANGSYAAGQTLSFTVTFDENIVVTGTDSVLGLTIGGAGRSAAFASKTATSITYTYTVQAGDTDADGIAVGGVTLGTTTIRDAGGNDAVLTLAGHLPSTAGVLVDTATPAIASVGVPANGTYVAGQHLDFIVTFDENVVVTGSDSALGLTVGSTSRTADFLSSSGGTVTYRYTVQAGDIDGNGVMVGGLSLGGDAIRDAAGNNASLTLNNVGATTGVLIDATVPAVAGTVTPPADGVYIVGETLSFTVTFDENVTVTGTGSTLGLNIGGAARNADYASKTANSITYAYTVQNGDNDADGIAVNGISLNGGVIRDAAGNNANLSLSGHLPSTAGVLVDGAPPAVSGNIGVPANGSYAVGQTLSFTVTFDENITVTGTDSVLGLTIGSTARSAAYESKTANSITYAYTVQAGDTDANGVSVGGITLNGDTVSDGAGNDAVLSLVGHVPSTAGVLVDTAAPAVASVSVPANGAYAVGQHLDFTVTFDENITVTGTDSALGLTVGSTARSADFLSSSGNTVTYRYTVQAGDTDGDGVSVGGLSLGGDAIRDAAGNDANLTLNNVGATTSVLVDADMPGVLGVVSVPATDTYVVGDTLSFTVTFTEDVTVTGTDSTLELTIGGTARSAAFGSKTANSITYAYTVQSGDNDGDGIAVGAISPGTSTIRDAAGNDASLALSGHVPATTGVLVDTAAPSFVSATVSGATLVMTYADAGLLDAAHAPGAGAFTVLAGGAPVSVTAVAVNGAAHTVTLTLASPVAAGATVTVAYQDLTGSNDVNAIQDAGGNDAASLAAASVTNTTSPPTPPTSPPQTETVDGVVVQTVISTAGGTQTQTVTIPVIQPTRVEQVGDNQVADIPLVTDGAGSTLLGVQIPAGIGLTASGSTAPILANNGLNDLIRQIEARTSGGSQEQSQLTGGGSGFVGGLNSGAQLLVQTIVVTGETGSSPLGIFGSEAGAVQSALVIDTRSLPNGAALELQNVDFAAVIGAATITGGAGSQHVWGDGASQNIFLGAGDDVLHGGGGNDKVGSATGQDKLYGDEGDDTVFGGEENDQVFGGSGADNVHGNQGDDFVQGNQGDDTVLGGQGDDLVFGGQDNDLAFGDIGNDRLYGDLGADTLQGNQGQDSLSGGEGNDLLMGGRDSDAIRGDAGDDFIWGDLGSDTLSGGSGADRFGFRLGEGADVITDFAFAQGDRIVLDGQGAGWTVSSNASGDAVLNLAGGGSVVLIGVSSADVTQAWFV